jgi:hypothetical protein
METVKVIGIKHNIRCETCGNSWGVYLREDGSYPFGWNVCIECKNKKSMIVKEMLRDDRKQVFQGSERV